MRWEYHTLKILPYGFHGGKVDDDRLCQALTHLGDQGGELCNSFETNMSSGASREVLLIFKRPGEDILQDVVRK